MCILMVVASTYFMVRFLNLRYYKFEVSRTEGEHMLVYMVAKDMQVCILSYQI